MKDDEKEIRASMAKWSRAVESKDPDAIIEDYAPDAVLYDAIPPFKTQGANNIRDIWVRCLPYFPDEFRSEHDGLDIKVSGELAIVCGFHHFVPTPADHPCGSTWMRVTVAFERVDERWRVFHEHVSVPFDPMSGKAATISAV